MSTFADLIADVEQYLYGYGSMQNQYSALKADIAAADLSFEIEDAPALTAGVLEIDDELMAIRGGTGTDGVNVFPWGRGTQGTTKALHLAGAKVTINPTIPRTVIKKAINETVQALYPQLFGVVTDETHSVTPLLVAYSLPAVARSVMGISVKALGPSLVFRPVQRFKMIDDPDPTLFPTGKAVEIYEAMTAGQPIKIVYRTSFAPFATEADRLTDLGLLESWRDLIRLGAVWRLIPALDAGRLQTRTIEAAGRATAQVQPYQALNVGKSVQQQFQQRLSEARRQLLLDHPTTQIRNN